MRGKDKSAAAESSEAYRNLVAKLEEIFQVDRGDLDFGVYRIINTMRSEISSFLRHGLLPQVRDVLEQYVSNTISLLDEKIKEAEENALKLKLVPDETQFVLELREQRQKLGLGEGGIEESVYSDLYNFFRRYYSEGDFVSLRRYKEGVYVIPYSGEEVKLHWANRDQYYIKSAENFNHYVFCPDAQAGEGDNPRRVVFETVSADLERDNNQGNSKRYMLAAENFIAEQEGALHIRFEWRKPDNGGTQKEINKETAGAILDSAPAKWRAALAVAMPTDSDPERTLLQKHLNTFTAKNTFDYFIHKDLHGFLQRELDFYIKTDILNLDNLDGADALAIQDQLGRARAVRQVARKIIFFVGALENMQKSLWEKKKFILRTDYCVTLGTIADMPDAAKLLKKIAANDAQWQEWQELHGITRPGKSPGKKWFAEHPTLPVDTAHFNSDPSFKDMLLASYDDIEDACRGVLIHGENFQALNLIREKYNQAIDCIYIDPPYNTDMSPILYKNDFRHSSWLSLLYGGVSVAKEMLSYGGAFAVAIDDAELYRLKLLLDDELGEENYIGTVVVQSNPGGRDINSHFAISHEYCLFYANPGRKDIILPREDDYEETKTNGFRRTGGLSSPEERSNSEFAIYYDPSTLKIVGIGGKREKEYPAEYSPSRVFTFDKSGEIVQLRPKEFKSKYPRAKALLPVFSKTGERGVWRWSDREKIMNAIKDGSIYIGANKSRVSVKLVSDQSPHYKLKTIWDESAYSATSHGTNLLQKMFGKKKTFSYPKSIYTVMAAVDKILFDESQENYSFAAAEKTIHALSLDKTGATVLDYFAGSGTTAHAVINLNRRDNTNRKFVLVEMGEYFSSALLPRVKKVIYAPKWEEGAPDARHKMSEKDIAGTPGLVKYQCIESFDDALDNLLDPTSKLDDEARSLLRDNPKVREAYMLHYLLSFNYNDVLSLIGGDEFAAPDVHGLKITCNGTTSAVKVDLPETFNYLLGLRVKTRRVIDGVLTITGENADGNILILWRNIAKMPSPKLNDWIKKHRVLSGDVTQVYVNGDHAVGLLHKKGSKWNVDCIEPVFHQLMFG